MVENSSHQWLGLFTFISDMIPGLSSLPHGVGDPTPVLPTCGIDSLAWSRKKIFQTKDIKVQRLATFFDNFVNTNETNPSWNLCSYIFRIYIYGFKITWWQFTTVLSQIEKFRFTCNLRHGFSVRLTDLQYQYIVLILPNETDILIIPIPIPFWQDMSRSFCRVTEQSTNLPFRYKLVSSAKMWYMHLTTCDWWRWWTRWEPAQCYHFGNTSFIFSITNKTSG